MSSRFKAALTLLTALSVLACSKQDELLCNYASADITTTPDEHCMLAGFAARSELSTEVHTPLRASCLVFAKGGEKVCVVSLDMMEISPALTDEIRDSISLRSGLDRDNILLHCIHTHSAPRTGGVTAQPGGSNYTFKQRTFATVEDLAVSTITDDKAFRPFTIEAGKCTTDINGNRCEKDGPCDHDVYAFRLLDKSGKPICAFFNISCHPVCMGPKSYLVGADYSGVARGVISEKWGCEVFQLSGAQGNVDPARGPRKVEYCEECGNSLAASLSGIEFEPFEMNGELKLFSNTVSLPYRKPEVRAADIHALADSLRADAVTSFPRFASDVTGWEAQMTEGMGEDEVIRSLDINLTGVNVGGLLMIFTQGEPFCEFQIQTRASFPEKTVIFAAYTNGQSAYLPSSRAFEVRKGYEYELEQDFVYTKAPYPMSSNLPRVYLEGIFKTLANVSEQPVYGIIPEPASIVPAAGFFNLKSARGIAAAPEFADIAEDFTARVATVSGISLKAAESAPKGIEIVKVEGMAPEAYRLEVTPEKVTVSASGFGGAFYGIQTLCQLLPAAIYGSAEAPGEDWKVPCCTVDDAPCFAYRGMLLDCGRYFYPKEEILKFIDLMAMHKQNYLQWHLTEDQGWRIEIKKYPRLTEVGAWRAETCGYLDKGGVPDGTPHGGFYTQDDAREIVEYARRRNITIIPEIELPGHSGAAIAAYPRLSCTPDEPKEVVTSWGVKEDVYCPSPETIGFLEDVFTELFDIFPSPYYHFGGDECPKTAWRCSDYCKTRAKELGLESVDDIQDYFVSHFDAFLREHGKTVIGWDEILDGKPAETAVVMSYRGHRPASRAMDRGMKTILCPNRWCYFDYEQQEVEDIPFNHHLFITLRKSYNWDWESMLDEDAFAKGGDGLLGLQACVWGENIPDVEKLELQTFPREASIAESSWTPAEKRNWNHFKMRMTKEFERLDECGVNSSRAFDNVIVNMSLLEPYPRAVELELDNPYAFIRYTTDGTDPDASSPIAPASIMVDKGDVVKARGYTADGRTVGDLMTRIF